MIKTKNLELSKVEIIKKKYDNKGRVIEEQFEYYYPKKEKKKVGFNLKK